MSWTRYTTSGGPGRNRPTDTVELGPGDVAGLDRKLLGEFDGQRILELGTGAGHSAIAMASGGARVVAIDPDAQQITATRAVVDTAEVHVELHQGDLASLAFLQADIFDAVVAIHSLSAVDDLSRVFRQVHRVLKPERTLLITLPHPASLMVSEEDTNRIEHAYNENGALGEGIHLTHRHTISHVFTQLYRANFRVDSLLEPAGDGPLPASVIFRARKVGT